MLTTVELYKSLNYKKNTYVKIKKNKSNSGVELLDYKTNSVHQVVCCLWEFISKTCCRVADIQLVIPSPL